VYHPPTQEEASTILDGDTASRYSRSLSGLIHLQAPGSSPSFLPKGGARHPPLRLDRQEIGTRWVHILCAQICRGSAQEVHAPASEQIPPNRLTYGAHKNNSQAPAAARTSSSGRRNAGSGSISGELEHEKETERIGESHSRIITDFFFTRSFTLRLERDKPRNLNR